MGSLGAPRYVEAKVPYQLSNTQVRPGTVGARRLKTHDVATRVVDARDVDCSLDTQGSQIVTHPSSLHGEDFKDADKVREVLYQEVQDIVRKATGAARVHVFSHLVRFHSRDDIKPEIDDPSIPDDAISKLTGPARGAHIDHSTRGSYQVLSDNLPEEADRFRNGGKRWAIINFWRPIETVKRDPLCLCDARTVDEGDLVERTVILPNTDAYEHVSKGKVFDLFSARPNPAHEWYYCSNMRPDEGWLLKIFDSEGGKGGICGPAPHTSFELPGEVPKEARRSCEFRTLVFWD
ncbi:uncharacterized protein AB675_10066 [Cyphellophora attinorum]|uniref:GA4 desaturase family protein n=1 Tax=Cyphellophora attinorum TaxID=1664694 RepID=A0A0N0NJ87_9EURO|nr:uncharacterized protein AB675_10066 [Phialophora attinorum]KPI36628.1 hypothetical protein AB675_10066 [Phialophora attinorum]